MLGPTLLFLSMDDMSNLGVVTLIMTVEPSATGIKILIDEILPLSLDGTQKSP